MTILKTVRDKHFVIIDGEEVEFTSLKKALNHIVKQKREKEEAVKYLRRIITKWNVFCKTHRKLAKAIKVVLDGEQK